MPARALIVAVEHYPRISGLHSDLIGTMAAADRFRRWLVETKGVDTSHIIECRNATRQQIVDAVSSLVTAGRSDTTELFVLFSGHGFSLLGEGDNDPPDVFAAADFVDLEHSAGACLKLNALRTRLANAMTFGRHYYFADICRNRAPVKTLNIPTLPDFGISTNQTPYTYSIFSTTSGEVAAGDSGFGRILCDGLSGQGTAKQWTGQAGQLDLTRMVVTFERLLRYVSEHMKDQPPQPHFTGALDQEILVLSPPPRFQCTVRIEQALADDVFATRITGSDTRIRLDSRMTGGEDHLTLVPDQYWIELTPSQDSVDPIELPVDLYEDGGVVFRKAKARPGPAAIPRGGELATLEVIGANNTIVRIRSLTTGQEQESADRFEGQVPPGVYRLSLIEDNRVEVRSAEVTTLPGQRLTFDLGLREATPPKTAIVESLPEFARDDRTITLSESLGWFASEDLALWLAVIGASRIYEDSGLFFQKLSSMPFQQFDDVKPGESPIYVLAGFEDGTSSPVIVGSSTNDQPDWKEMTGVEGYPGILECRIASPAGPRLLSLKLEERSSLTVPTHCLLNRATLIVVIRSKDAEIHLRQFILPLGRLVDHLPLEVRDRLPGSVPYDPEKPDRLPMVKFLAQSEELFTSRRAIAPPVGSKDSPVWNGLLSGKWVDPIMCLLAAYALLREDQLEPSMAQTLVSNMRTYFPGMADTEAIARLAGLSYTTPASPPLFLDGLAAFPDRPSVFPLPESALDYRAPWVRWRGAVEDPPPPPVDGHDRNGPSPWRWIQLATLAVILTVGALYVAKEKRKPPEPDTTKVSLESLSGRELIPPSLTYRLTAGGDFTIEAEDESTIVGIVQDEAGNRTDQPIFWASTDTSIVQLVGDRGDRARGIQPGAAEVIARIGTMADTIQITVVPRARIVPADTTLEMGEAAQFLVDPPGGDHWTWRSGDSSVLAISQVGIVSALAAGSATIQAERAGAIREARVNVLPPGMPQVTPENLSFGDVVAGGNSPPQAVTVSNPRRTALNDFSVALISGAESYRVDHQCGATLPPMSPCVINISFMPRSAGFLPGQLRIGWSPSETLVHIGLTGSSIPETPKIISGGVLENSVSDQSTLPSICGGPLIWHPVPGDGIEYLVRVEEVQRTVQGSWRGFGVHLTRHSDTTATVDYRPVQHGPEIISRWTVSARATGVPEGAQSERYYYACRIG